MHDRDSPVIGEGVALDLPAAGVATRTGAALLDVTIQVITFVTLAVLVTVFAADYAAYAAAMISLIVVVAVVAPALLETLTRGRSVGKAAFGLRVVRDDGGPVRGRHTIVRALVGFGELWLSAGSVAMICSLANARGKRVGDYLAGTHVVIERVARDHRVSVAMPPALAGWARAADLARLPDQLAMTASTFVRRAAHLTPASRQAQAADLASRVLAYASPPPPTGTSPEDTLAAVLAERRRRDLDRLHRETAHAARLSASLRRLPHQAEH